MAGTGPIAQRAGRADPPHFTVITATFNCREQLAMLATSLRAQAYQDYEWIVIDGASVDGTLDVIKSLGSQIAYTVSEPDRGIYDAWNKGIAHARGQRILFLGADDEIGRDWLAMAAKIPSSVDLIYGDLEVVDREARRLSGVVRGRPWGELNQMLRDGMHVLPPHAGLVHHRRLFTNSKFNTEFRLHADYDFVMRAHIREAAYLPGVCQARFALGGASSSLGNVFEGYEESRRILAQFGITMPWRARLHWRTKLFFSRFPRAYNLLQRFRWRITLLGRADP